MRIPRSSFYATALALIASTCLAAVVGASPVPQASTSGVASPSKTNPAVAGNARPRGNHKAKAAAKILPAQDGSSQILAATSTAPHLETIITPDEPTSYVQSFDKLPVGSTGPIQTDTLTNTSTDTTVNISGITISEGSDTTDYALDAANCPASLAPGQSCTFTIAYAPTSACAGNFAALDVADDDPGGDVLIGLTAGTTQAGGLSTTALPDTSAASAMTLAQAIAGTGITITDATFTGAPNAAGTFTGGSGILGLGNGIALSNGSIVNVVGPNCSTGITGVNNQPGDTDLSSLIGQPTFDASVLNFDFVPTSALVTFQYVFASDEYQDFVFDFNDAFAFFVNGQNIALVPQTNSIVSINNVNNGSTEPGLTGIPPVNPQFYLNNDFQVPAVSPFNTEMDGMTVVLTATTRVNPGVSNHIKLAIADARDQEIDSNVFILAGSLTSTNVLLSPSTLAFGNQNLGNTSAGQTFTLTNLGTTALSGVAISTNESGNFSQTNNCGTSVAAGASCTVTVKFNPQGQAGGVIQENLQISDSAPDSPQRVALSGTSVAGPFVTLSPFSLTFGPQATGTTSPAQTVTLTNTGSTGLTIGTISASTDGEGDGSDFIAGNNCPENAIPPNGSCTITVTWMPSEGATIPATGTVTITDNAQNQGTQTIGLTGGVTATVGIAPPTVGFGNQAINTTSAAQTITVTNTGTAVLTVPSVVVSSNFAETNTCTANPVAAGGTCTISVTFTPTAATAYSGTVSITDTATNSPQTVTLTGTGTSAAGSVTIAPGSLTFASQALGTTSAAQTVTITNNGTAPASLTGFSISANFGVVGDGGGTCTATTTLIGGASCTFQITFGPTATGTLTGAFTVTDSVTGSSPLMVALSGTGTAGAGAITLTPSSLMFGAQTVGTTSAAQTVTVSNTGTTVVTFTSIGVTPGFGLAGTSATPGICNPETPTIPAGGSCTILVQFAPTATGNVTGTLTVVDNAAGGQQTVALSGTGVNSSVIISVPSGGSTTATTTPGGTAFFGLLISGAPGVTGTVQLGCSSPSPFITCTVIPSTITLTGGTTEVAFGIQTFCKGATTTGGFVPGGFGGGISLGLMGLMFVGILGMFGKNRRVAVAFAMIMIVMALGAGSCASLPKGASGVTPAGTYNITLTTTLNGNTQTLPNFLSLVVK
jgi:hypothetical protein